VKGSFELSTNDMSDPAPMLIYPIPSLISTLVNREEEKGSALTEAEVIEIRNGCKAIALPRDVAEKIDSERGYKDIDPERCWEAWQEVRKSF
jgi:hypothetical protein